jgi:hypothetical protein
MYLAASGRDGGALGFWHVLGMWKIAIIAEGCAAAPWRSHATPPRAARPLTPSSTTWSTAPGTSSATTGSDALR